MSSISNQKPTTRSSTRFKPKKSEKIKIFVGGIPRDLPPSVLYSYFSKFGKVKNVDLPFNKKKGVYRGFGFVSFDSIGAVERIMD